MGEIWIHKLCWDSLPNGVTVVTTLSHGFRYSYVRILTCISGPAVAIAWIVSAPIDDTMFWNFSVSIAAISLDLETSRLFCSDWYFNSASRSLLRRCSADSLSKKTKQTKTMKKSNCAKGSLIYTSSCQTHRISAADSSLYAPISTYNFSTLISIHFLKE